MGNAFVCANSTLWRLKDESTSDEPYLRFWDASDAYKEDMVLTLPGDEMSSLDSSSFELLYILEVVIDLPRRLLRVVIRLCSDGNGSLDELAEFE